MVQSKLSLREGIIYIHTRLSSYACVKKKIDAVKSVCLDMADPSIIRPVSDSGSVLAS